MFCLDGRVSTHIGEKHEKLTKSYCQLKEESKAGVDTVAEVILAYIWPNFFLQKRYKGGQSLNNFLFLSPYLPHDSNSGD